MQNHSKFRTICNFCAAEVSFTAICLLSYVFYFAESGLKGGFHENISYDYNECCAKKGISPLCKAMCKPRDMHIHYFDPTRYHSVIETL